MERDPQDVRRLLICAKEVMEADGVIAAEEIEMVNAIAREITGVGFL